MNASMRGFLTAILLSLTPAMTAAASGTPHCRITHFDEQSGLSQRLVKQVVRDSDGIIWMATWNGLNRFDGYEFARIRPGDSDPARRHSQRFSNIRLNSQGDLWCRVDDRILTFHTRTNRFSDTHSTIEEALGRPFMVSRIMPADSGRTVIETTDREFLTIIDSEPGLPPTISATRPKIRYHTSRLRNVRNVAGYPDRDLLYSHLGPDSSVWIITRDGEVRHGTDHEGPFELIATIPDPADGSLYSCMADGDNAVWLRSNLGAYLVEIGELPYEQLPMLQPSRVRAAMIDSRDRIWLAESDENVVTVRTSPEASPLYLTSSGTLTPTPARFGVPVYCIAEAPDGRIWIGSKPGGLFRLTPAGTAYKIDHLAGALDTDAPYSICFDSHGRLWVATLGGGVEMCPDPAATQPEFLHLGSSDSYPSQALKARQLTLAGDSLMIVATTGGLCIGEMPAPGRDAMSMTWRLHISEPGRDNSLGNVAVMQTIITSDGLLCAATESDGVNTTPLQKIGAPQLDFTRYNTRLGLPSDVAHSIAQTDGDHLLVVSNNSVFTLQPSSGAVRSMDRELGRGAFHFSDAPPCPLPDGRWLLCHDAGAIAVRITDPAPESRLPLFFTGVSIQNRGDSILPYCADTITLSPDERNVTVRFAAMAMGDIDVRYSFRMGDAAPWTDNGTNRTVTLLDLSPGTHTLQVRAVDTSGHHLAAERTLTIEVTPKWWETMWARMLALLLALAIAGAIIWIVIYVRAIRRSRRETLEAYLKLLEARAETAQTAHEPTPTEAEAPANTSLSEADEIFMQRLMDYVGAHLSDPEADIEAMAAATATSRSGLGRKMRALLGVTPTEFVRQSRLARAATLLTETDLPIKEIAAECGFSDIGYFGKCFKASRGLTPTAWRTKEARR